MPDVDELMVEHIHSTLDWVGMSEIHLPARITTPWPANAR